MTDKQREELIEDMARKEFPGLDWALLENLGATAVQRAWFRTGYKKAQAAMQLEIARLKNNQCQGHFRIGCAYMSGCNTICNKCGHIHSADTGLAYSLQLSERDAKIAQLEEHIRKSQKQEPVAWANTNLTGKSEHWNCVYFFKEIAVSSVAQNGGNLLPLYASPIIPPLKGE